MSDETTNFAKKYLNNAKFWHRSVFYERLIEK